ncbi:MAG: gliding motility-associated C-terminal domain-containing protein [Flavobacteriales bacterium]|jgi:gliding motility-associated-like protein|nr:gliding motility-associated C-terminal domain-containing protein [Flavobacteriales bacterium]
MKQLLLFVFLGLLLNGCVKEQFAPEYDSINLDAVIITHDTLICGYDFLGEINLINGLYNSADSSHWEILQFEPEYIQQYAGQDTFSIRFYELLDTGIVRLTNYSDGDSSSIQIKIINCFQTLYIPSGFSPNGDGLNDTWYPIFTNITDLHWIIRSENGQVILDNEGDPTVSWDGAWNKNPAPAGLYRYWIRYLKVEDGKTETKEGWIQLYRNE